MRGFAALTAIALSGVAPACANPVTVGQKRSVVAGVNRGVPIGAAAFPSLGGLIDAPGSPVPGVPLIAGTVGIGIVPAELLRSENQLPSRIEAVSRIDSSAIATRSEAPGFNSALGVGLVKISEDVGEAQKGLADGNVNGALELTQRRYDNSPKTAGAISVAQAEREFTARVDAFARSGKIAGYSGAESALESDIERVRRHVTRMDPRDPDYKTASRLLNDLIARRARVAGAGAK